MRNFAVGEIALVSEDEDLPLSIGQQATDLIEPDPELWLLLSRMRLKGCVKAKHESRPVTCAPPPISGDPSRRQQQPRQRSVRHRVPAAQRALEGVLRTPLLRPLRTGSSPRRSGAHRRGSPSRQHRSRRPACVPVPVAAQRGPVRDGRHAGSGPSLSPHTTNERGRQFVPQIRSAT